MGELADRARSRLTTNREAHDRDMRALLSRLCEAAERTATYTERWAQRMGQANDVLETGDATVPSSGVWYRSFRAPYAAVALVNRSDSTLKVTSSGPGSSPGDGAGAFTVDAWAFVTLPLVGTAVSVYGQPDAEFSYSVLVSPWPPFAAATRATGTEPTRPDTATLTTVAAATSSVSIAAANPNRRGLWVVNDSASATLYLAMDGAAASVTHFSVNLLPGDRYEMPYPAVTTAVTGIWDAAVGAARVTELT